MHTYLYVRYMHDHIDFPERSAHGNRLVASLWRIRISSSYMDFWPGGPQTCVESKPSLHPGYLFFVVVDYSLTIMDFHVGHLCWVNQWTWICAERIRSTVPTYSASTIPSAITVTCWSGAPPCTQDENNNKALYMKPRCKFRHTSLRWNFFLFIIKYTLHEQSRGKYMSLQYFFCFDMNKAEKLFYQVIMIIMIIVISREKVWKFENLRINFNWGWFNAVYRIQGMMLCSFLLSHHIRSM